MSAVVQTPSRGGGSQRSAKWLKMDALLRHLAGERASASEIAAELSKRFRPAVTRNAVIGYCTRNSIELNGARTPAPKRPGGEPAAYVPRAKRAPVRVDDRAPDPCPVAFPMHDFGSTEPDPMLGYEPVHLLEAKHDHCRWIEGDALQAMCCGGPALVGSAYCDTHHKRVYAKRPTRSEAQRRADQVRVFQQRRAAPKRAAG